VAAAEEEAADSALEGVSTKLNRTKMKSGTQAFVLE
jgi:hypothetical protein